MLTSGATMGANYDQTLLGNYTQPYETLREIAPFVIIDEPHKFARSQKTFTCLIDNIKPQCIIRYGATFPEALRLNILRKSLNLKSKLKSKFYLLAQIKAKQKSCVYKTN